MRAKDVMSDGVMSLGDDATVQEAIELLVNTGVSAMPVLDKDGIMVGIVSEADLIRREDPEAWLQRGLSDDATTSDSTEEGSRPVTEVMTKNVKTTDENTPLGEIAKLMATYHVKRIPIVRERSVVGIVSRLDLLKALVSRRPASAVFSSRAEPAPLSAADLLHKEVTEALQGHSWSVARRGDIVVNNGIVHLWGVVPSAIVLEAYRTTTASVPGVKSVVVHMHILSPS
jgi:CBS domain-containing protein